MRTYPHFTEQTSWLMASTSSQRTVNVEPQVLLGLEVLRMSWGGGHRLVNGSYISHRGLPTIKTGKHVVTCPLSTVPSLSVPPTRDIVPELLLTRWKVFTHKYCAQQRHVLAGTMPKLHTGKSFPTNTVPQCYVMTNPCPLALYPSVSI